MNYKCTLDFFFPQIYDKVPLFYWWRKKKNISTEMDDRLLCWRQNSCNRNGNVLPLSDHVRFEMHSPGGNLSYRAFLFPSSLSLWSLLITRWDAESGLFRAWQKSNSMNLMSLFDLSDPAHMLMHTHMHTHSSHRKAHLFSLILFVVLWGWSLSQYVLGRSQGNTLDKLRVHKRANRDKQTHSYGWVFFFLCCSLCSFFFLMH